MKLKIDPHAGVPIYKQMIAQIASAIETGELECGAKLPSIRELSTQLDINPNTTAKVYRELELHGLIESKAGSGCFVRPQSEEASRAIKKVRIQELFDKMLGEAKALKLDEQDVLQFLEARATTWVRSKKAG